MIAAVLAAVGFMVLVVLHELGHFVAAKAVGMRVERFALFFPPLLLRRKGKGETEYALGAIPLGGYVKISGMSPYEELPPDVAPRAYFRQKPWKRIVVILAGPMVNVVLAFLILGGLILHSGVATDGARVAEVQRGQPAEGRLVPGDVITRVDGRGGSRDALSARIASHRCPGTLTKGCRASTPVTLTIERDGRQLVERVRPRYDPAAEKMRIGFVSEPPTRSAGLGDAVGGSLDQMWFVTRTTVDRITGIFNAEKRKDLHGVVGSYETARSAFSLDVTTALFVLALISLSLGIVNLFPFLPLDGGHVFWAVAEKVRGKAIPFSVMEKSGVVGFALVIMIAAIGFTNDLNTLQGPGFSLR